MRRFVHVVAAAAVAVAVQATPVAAQPFPDRVPLPDGFNPEGIAIGPGSTFYVGSLNDGDVYRGDLRSGDGGLFVDAPDGRMAVGMKADVAGGRLFVAGGVTGQAFVYDLRTGADLGAVQLADQSGATFVNDVTLTSDAAWLTDSDRPVLYRIPFLPGGALGAPEVLHLSGPGAVLAGAFSFNGIDATPDGSMLVAMHTGLETLFTVDPRTGATRAIDVGQPLVDGDGILLDGPRLWVVQNFANRVTEIRLAPDMSSGTVVRVIDSGFRIPTTVARHGNTLAVVDARFDQGIPAPPDTDYEVVLVDR